MEPDSEIWSRFQTTYALAKYCFKDCGLHLANQDEFLKEEEKQCLSKEFK
jgi:hypothetical protein